MICDVTQEGHLVSSVDVVKAWLAEKGKKRRLHAIVNNAGVGLVGLIDWASIQDYEFCMNVNCYGMIRTVKAYLPLLKSQVVDGNYTSARIVNVTSMAGLTTAQNGSIYFVSKHAAEAFTNCLRLEMRDWDIDVVTVNPSFHETPLVTVMESQWRQCWERLDPDLRQQYGEGKHQLVVLAPSSSSKGSHLSLEYFEGSVLRMLDPPKSQMWRAHVVTDQLVNAVELAHPPLKMLVGLDAKFVLVSLRMMAVWLQDILIPQPAPRPQILNRSGTTKVD